MPQRPMKPPPPERKKRGSGWLSLAFVAFVMMGLVTILLTAPLGQIGIAILIGGAIFPLVIGFHYFVWGRWVQNVLRNHPVEDD